MEDVMINRVGGQGPLPPQRVIEPAGTRGGGSPVAATTPVSRVLPRAELSSLPIDVSKLAASPPVDAAKVAALKTAIAAGTYKPNPAAIADRMVETDFAPKAGK
jgi:negative regulator of flagellin synthesis FlgM